MYLIANNEPELRGLVRYSALARGIIDVYNDGFPVYIKLIGTGLEVQKSKFENQDEYSAIQPMSLGKYKENESLTGRDTIAIQAMKVLIRNKYNFETKEILAKHAYEIADAMLKQREL